MNINYRVTKSLNSIAISISIFTVLSAILYAVFGRGSFQLINPFTMALSTPIYNASISLLLYAMTGLYFFYFITLIKNDKLGFNKWTLVHFIVSVVSFSVVGFLSGMPINASMDVLVSYYTSVSWVNLIKYPIIVTLVGYCITYVVMWGYYVRQIKQINNKIK